LQKTFSTERSVIGDVFVVPDTTTGKAKFAYAADLGGNVYRISGVDAYTEFASTSPANWTITKIASLGCDTTAPCSANRKFTFGPDVLWDGTSYLLLLGSGDREKPLTGFVASNSVSNLFFMIKDQPTNGAWLTSEAANCETNNFLCKSSLYGITTSATPSEDALATKKGWYLALADNEQVVTSAVGVLGTVTFSTHTPAVYVAGSCTSNLGTARVYNVSYLDASSTNGTDARSEVIAGGGLPPSPVAGMVTLDDGQTVPFVIGASPNSPIEAKFPPVSGAGSQSRGRVYWYIER
jgi:type IV pilus assembly protein PilY1